MRLFRFEPLVSALFLSSVWCFCGVLRLVHQQDIGLIVSANNNIVFSGLGLRPECMFGFVLLCLDLFYFLLSLYVSILRTPLIVLFFFFSFGGYHIFIPINSWVQVIWDGIPRLDSTVPLSTTTILVCFLPSRRYFLACFVTAGYISGESATYSNTYCEKIQIVHDVFHSPFRASIAKPLAERSASSCTIHRYDASHLHH